MKPSMVLAVTMALVVGAAPARGQEEQGTLKDWLSGNVAVISDYTFRGISQTLEEPAIQGGIDLAHPSGVYLGTWASSVNFGEDLSTGPRAHMELDVYGGFRPTVLGTALDLGAIYYAYPGADGGRGYNFAELGLGASRTVAGLGTGLQLKYSPDFFASSGEAVYYGGSLSVPVSLVTVSGSLGRQRIDNNAAFGTPDYTDWGIGLGVEVAGFNLSGRYLGTSMGEGECFSGSELCESRVVVSISRAM